MNINYRPKAIYIRSPRKAFCRQTIPEFSCTKMETIERGISILSCNGDRKIKQLLQEGMDLHNNREIELI